MRVNERTTHGAGDDVDPCNARVQPAGVHTVWIPKTNRNRGSLATFDLQRLTGGGSVIAADHLDIEACDEIPRSDEDPAAAEPFKHVVVRLARVNVGFVELTRPEIVAPSRRLAVVHVRIGRRDDPVLAPLAEE